MGTWGQDEISCSPTMGLPFPVVENLTAELRAVFPRPFILYMNDCVDRWPHIPPALDLVGMDRYTVSRNGTDEVSGAKAYFTASVFPKLREHQRKSPRHCWYLGRTSGQDASNSIA